MTRPKLVRMLAASLALTLLLGGCQVATDPYGRTVMSMPTLGQALGVARQPVRAGIAYTPVAAPGSVQDQRVVAERTVQVVATGNGHAILVDGRVLATDEQDDRVVIRSVHEGSGRTYVLVEEQSGGNACPSMFQAIDLSGANPTISPQFGNCSDLPRISVVSGALKVAVLRFRAAPAVTFVFRDGRLSR